MLAAGQERTLVIGEHETEMAVVVVSHGKIKIVPAGRKRMERRVPKESGVVRVMEEGAGMGSGIHEEMMNEEGNPFQLAVNQVFQFDNVFYVSVQ
jgi:alanine dehydrogenase